MNRFGEDLPEIQSIPIIQPLPKGKKNKKSRFKPKKFKASHLMHYAVERLPILDNSFGEMIEEYKASDETDEDALQTASYLEGEIQAILDILHHVGFDTRDYHDLIPNLIEKDKSEYAGGEYIKLLREG